METSRFSYLRLMLLGCGFMGTVLLWGIYNAYVPLFLQAGRPDFVSPPGLKGFGLGTELTGFIMTLDNIAALFILPYIGVLSDRTRTRFGRRKPFIMAGAPVAALGFLAIPLALGSPLPMMMAAVMVTLLAMDLFRTPVIALMPDITPSQQRSQANGVINVMGGVGTVLAFLVGGALYKHSVTAPFLFGAVAMLVGSALVLLFIREPDPDALNQARAAAGEPLTEEEPGLLASLRQVLGDRDRSAVRLLVAIFFWFLGYNALEVFFTSFAVKELGVDPGAATKLLTFFSLSILLFSIPAGFLGARFGRRRTILTGIVLFAAMLGWGFVMTDVSMVKAMLVAAGVSWSLILVNSLPMVVDCAPESRIGAYTGLYYLASQSSAVAGPVVAGQIISLAGNSYRASFLYGSITLMLALAFMWGVRRGEARPA